MPLGKRKTASGPATRRVRPRKGQQYAQDDSDAPSEEQISENGDEGSEIEEDEEEEVEYDSDAEVRL